jgi:hypothetical protein
MKTAILIATFICGFIIYLTELNHQQIQYDCRFVSYPMAIDIPKKVIQQCKS